MGSASVGCMPSSWSLRGAVTIFQEGYVSLAYEVAAKMAADIHTKSFRIPCPSACQLINIFPPEQIGSQDIMDLMRPTHSQSTDEKGQQLYMFKSEAPCFPYVGPTLRLPYCRRCFIARVFRVKKVCRSKTVSSPSWLSSFRACCGIRRPRCRQDVICAQPGFFTQVRGIRWRTTLSFRTHR